MYMPLPKIEIHIFLYCKRQLRYMNMIRRTTSRKNDKVVHFMVQNPEYDNFMSHKVTSIIFRWKQIQAYPIPIDLFIRSIGKII